MSLTKQDLIQQVEKDHNVSLSWQNTPHPEKFEDICRVLITEDYLLADSVKGDYALAQVDTTLQAVYNILTSMETKSHVEVLFHDGVCEHEDEDGIHLVKVEFSLLVDGKLMAPDGTPY